MKTPLFTLLLICSSALSSFAQSSAGLIAHWDMNGSTNDVSGNGHDGTAHNIVADTGINGMPNTAYRFNGVNSWITTHYHPDINVSQYSICATVKILGFYAGTCQDNVILTRGTALGNCLYTLQFNDKPVTNSGCSTLDTTAEVFWSGASAPSATLSPASVTQYAYTPHIAENQWYKIVATFNDTTYKLYVNDTLKSSVTILNAGLPMGTGADSLSIGYDFKEASSGYPYGFNGVIDDIRLYNRVLADTEIVAYSGDSCGVITSQPTSVIAYIGDTASFTIASSIVGATYQWQQNSGTGFVNLSNAGIYSGVNTTTLTISGITTGISLDLYRCLVSSPGGLCNATSQSATLSASLGINDVIVSDMVSVYPNPSHSSVTVQFPYDNVMGSVMMINQLGQVVAQKTLSNKQVAFDVQSVPSGLYIFRINANNSIIYKQFQKN